jgi:hypothetical protein
MATRATLAGFPLLGHGAFRWEFRPGVEPTLAEADFAPEHAAVLLDGELRPLKLGIEASDAAKIEIDGVFVIQELPGPNPRIRRLLLADRRWFWSRKHVRRSFNVRRRAGVSRAPSPGAPPVVDPVVDEVAYAPWSLRDGTPWDAEQALRDVLEELDGFEAAEGGLGGLDWGATGRLDQVPFENLHLDDPGDQAVARLLAYLPEYQVVATPQGTILVYSRLDQGETELMEPFGPEMVGAGHIELCSLERLRPREIRVLFTREAEVRFDFAETETGASVVQNPEERFAENVLPIPDFQLAVGGRTLAQGTWITIAQALAAWGPAPGIGPITVRTLRIGLVPFMDLWAGLELAGARDPDADWTARLAALQTHWRRTFRINRRWMDRIARLNAYRVATVDPVTGTRGPALAWSDYCLLNSLRSLIADIRGGHDLRFAINQAAYPSGGKLASARHASPARVEVVDPDQGIIRLEWLMDELRLHDTVMPGTIANNPSPDFGQRSGAIGFNVVLRSFDEDRLPQFAAGYKAIVLLSAIPASPNDGRQLHAIAVKPADVMQDLPESLRSQLFRGPPMEVRVLPSLETARVAWVDDRKGDIEQLFGLGGDPKSPPDLDGLLLNDGAGGRRAQAGSLNEIAKAVALRVWAGFADRNIGSARFGLLAKDVVPRGLIDSISVEVDTTGVVSSGVETGRTPPKVSLFSLLPGDVRTFLLRLAQPGKE